MKVKRLKTQRLSTLTINRSKWGTGIQGGSLLNPYSSKMCCLGFYCRKIGYSADEIMSRSMPTELYVRVPGLVDRIDGAYTNTLFAEAAALINDDIHSTGPERENALRKLGAKHNIKIRFTN